MNSGYIVNHSRNAAISDDPKEKWPVLEYTQKDIIRLVEMAEKSENPALCQIQLLILLIDGKDVDPKEFDQHWEKHWKPTMSQKEIISVLQETNSKDGK